MSGEQRDNNLGIDPELRNTDPLEYTRRLNEVRKRLHAEMIESNSGSHWEFVVQKGPDIGATFPLGSELISIGRGVTDTFQLQDCAVTRCQLKVSWNSDRMRHHLRVAGDSSTRLNGSSVPRNSGTEHDLSDGDLIQIGGTVLRYQRSAT